MQETGGIVMSALVAPFMKDGKYRELEPYQKEMEYAKVCRVFKVGGFHENVYCTKLNRHTTSYMHTTRYLQETGDVAMSASVAPFMKDGKYRELDEETKHTEVCHVY